ncbi:MAG: GntP family permease [Planctomycetaceae bacterium]
MLTLAILATGLTIVIGGILGLRLHAFVALVLAGMTVSLLSPSSLVTRSAMMEAAIRKVEFDSENRLVLVAERLKKFTDVRVVVDPGHRKPLQIVGQLSSEVTLQDWPGDVPFEAETDSNATAAEGPACYRFTEADNDDSASLTGPLKLIALKDFTAAVALGDQSFMARLTAALGSYCGSLAILIVAASIIGRCLLDSGAADRIVKSTLNVVGEKNAPAAFVVSGFTLSIPVFFDTVFYLMIPLGKALRLRTGGNYLLYVLSIVAGGTMAHSLVPPTPGPLFIAEAFGVSLAAMIVGGCVVGLFSASVGMLYAVWVNKRYELKLPEEDSDRRSNLPADTASAGSAFAGSTAVSPEPGLIVSLIPIVLPVLLITCGALIHKETPTVSGEPAGFRWAGLPIPNAVAEAFSVLGEKNLALMIAAVFAVLMYVRLKRPSRDVLAKSLQEAVSSAGTIILVTAAGGAFGKMMRQASVAELLEGLPTTSPVMLVVAAFLVTTAVRSAQGSATVAMMTSAGIFGGLVASGAAGVDPLYVALAVGCGSKPIAWMNDSGFWVITRMSGMTEREGLRYVTPMTALAGLAGLAAVILGVVLFP